MNKPLSRRGFLTVSATLSGGALLVGCTPAPQMGLMSRCVSFARPRSR